MKPYKSVAAIGAAVLSLSLVACGSPGSKAAESGPAAAGAGASLSDIEKMIEAGKSGLLYSDGEDKDATPTTLTSRTGWQGPTSTPEPAADKKIAVLYCVKGTSCEDAALAVEEAATSLGWETMLIDGKATPQGYADGMEAALANNVDAIVTVAVPETVIASGIASAHKQGILVTTIAEDPTGAADHYDSYIPLRETLSAMIEAWYAIADTGGEADVAFLWDVSLPHLKNAHDAVVDVVKGCEGCSIVANETADTATFADPIKIGQQAASIAQRFPDLDYLLTVYDLGIPAITQNLEAVGSNAKVATKNARASSLDLVADGAVTMDSGTSTGWAGYAMVDELIRLFADEEPIPYWEQGLPVHIFDASNVGDGSFDWEAEVDFKGEYSKLWGLQ
jgi:ribose transport system substrate-binding protein